MPSQKSRSVQHLRDRYFRPKSPRRAAESRLWQLHHRRVPNSRK